MFVAVRNCYVQVERYGTFIVSRICLRGWSVQADLESSRTNGIAFKDKFHMVMGIRDHSRHRRYVTEWVQAQ